MQQYLISRVASMLGLSANTLRMYEQEGIIPIRKNKRNGYRYFTAYDITQLMRSRIYRGYGFSLQDTGKLLQGSSREDILFMLERRDRDMEQEMQLMKMKQEQLSSFIERLQEIDSLAGRFIYRERPAMFVMKYRMQDKLLDDPILSEHMSRWIQHMPLVQPISCIHFADPFDFFMGLSFEAKYQDILKIEPNPYIFMLPKTHSLYSIRLREIKDDKPLDAEAEKVWMQSFQKNLSQMGGDPSCCTLYFRTILTYCNEGKTYSAQEYWMPFKNET